MLLELCVSNAPEVPTNTPAYFINIEKKKKLSTGLEFLDLVKLAFHHPVKTMFRQSKLKQGL